MQASIAGSTEAMAAEAGATSAVSLASGNAAFNRRIAGSEVMKSPIWSTLTTRIDFTTARSSTGWPGIDDPDALIVDPIVVRVT